MSSEKKNPIADLLKVALTLFVIAALVAVLLAVANSVTAPIIERSAQQRLEESLSELIKDASFEQVKTVEIDSDVAVLAVYQGTDQAGKNAGYCVHVAPSGYSDTIEMMVAINKDGAVIGVRILSISDTPGVGMKVQSDENFKNSVIGKTDTITVVKDNPMSENEVQGISGATISSTAYVDGVNAALETVKALSALEVTE